jgi:hypothetical protein
MDRGERRRERGDWKSGTRESASREILRRIEVTEWGFQLVCGLKASRAR